MAAAATNATPLISLDAVVMDTETTGLDSRKARVLEIAALKIMSGRIDRANTFRTLVDPKEAISAFSTAIHGIDNAKVAGAPAFPDAWSKFRSYAADAI